jgi:phosphopantetheine adenylyltransferase
MSIIGVNDAEKLKVLILDQRERVIRSMRGIEQSQNVNVNSSADLLASIHSELKEIKEILRSK